MKLFRTINFRLLFLLSIIFFGLAFLSFKLVLASEGKPAGSFGEGAFKFFQFPTHYLFNLKAGDTFYFGGFILNSIIYAFIIERTIYYSRKKPAKKTSPRYR